MYPEGVQLVLAGTLVPMVIKVMWDSFSPSQPTERHSWTCWMFAGVGTLCLMHYEYGRTLHMGYLMPSALTVVSMLLAVVAWHWRHDQPAVTEGK